MNVSTAEFRRVAARIADLAADYLDDLGQRPIVPAISGAELDRLLSGKCPEDGLGERALEALEGVVQHSRAQNGRFLGYVLGSGEPVAAAADLLASALNQNVTAWRSAPAAITVERAVVSWLAQAIGCEGFRGSLMGGGSMANLAGLAMAREAKAAANASGYRGGLVYASEEVHMSIPKAVALLGIGRDHLRLVPADSRQRMRVDLLDRAISEDRAAGLVPIAVVASAGTVATGAVDPLAEISEVARRHGAWLHVDGAYGALAAIAAPERLGSLALADSLSLDPHKWLYQPVDVGCLLYRDAEAARRAFSATGDYVRTTTSDPVEGFAFFEESPELSRRFRALKLWLSLRYHGLSAFREAIRADLRHADALAERVASEPKLELLTRGELSAVCFRYLGDPELPQGDRDAVNESLLAAVDRAGRVYLSNARVGGRFALRACFTNHRTSDRDVDAVVDEVLRAGAAVSR